MTQPISALKTLDKEDRIKLVKVAEDVLDRDGWIAGNLHMFRWKKGEAQPEVAGHCAIGAMHTAAVELGLLEPMDYSYCWAGTSGPMFSDENNFPSDPQGQYGQVADLMGWPFNPQYIAPEEGEQPIADVYRANDSHGRDKAFQVINKYL